MDIVFHPITGEKGYFASEREKSIIDVALINLLQQTKDSSHSVRGLNE